MVDAVDVKDAGGNTVSVATINALIALIGEVQASPTSNTVLDRLKVIAAGITTLGGYVDGLEALATSLNGYVDGLETLAAAATPAGENHIGQVGGHTARIAASSFNRPADTTAYASGDLVANSTTAGSVTVLRFAVGREGGPNTGILRRAQISKSNASLTNASFRLHLYSASPTPANGDNGAWSTSGAANYLGAFDITVDKAFTDGAVGIGVPLAGAEIGFASATVYGLLEARAAYTPASGEAFVVTLETVQN